MRKECHVRPALLLAAVCVSHALALDTRRVLSGRVEADTVRDTGGAEKPTMRALRKCNADFMDTEGRCTPRIAGSASFDAKNPRAVFLSFDDGPGTGTRRVLDALKNVQVKATFYLTGVNFAVGFAGADNVRDSIELLHRMVDEGHMLAAHSFDHMQECHYAPVQTAVFWDFYNFVQGIDIVKNEIECNTKSACFQLGVTSRCTNLAFQHRALQDMEKYSRMPCSNVWRTHNYNYTSSANKNPIAAVVGDELYKAGKLVQGWDGMADWKFDAALPYHLYPEALYEAGLTLAESDRLNALASANNGDTAWNMSTLDVPCLRDIEKNSAEQAALEARICSLSKVNTQLNATIEQQHLKASVEAELTAAYSSQTYNYNPRRPCQYGRQILDSGLPCNENESVCLMADYIDAVHYDVPKIEPQEITALVRSGEVCDRQNVQVTINRSRPVFQAASVDGIQKTEGPAKQGKVAFLSHDRYFASEAQQLMLEKWLRELKRRQYTFPLMRHYHLPPSAMPDEAQQNNDILNEYLASISTLPVVSNAFVISLTFLVWGFAAILLYLLLHYLYQRDPWLRRYGFCLFDKLPRASSFAFDKSHFEHLPSPKHGMHRENSSKKLRIKKQALNMTIVTHSVEEPNTDGTRQSSDEGKGDSSSISSSIGGWEAVEDAQGLYYYNSTTGETSWDRPAALDGGCLNRSPGSGSSTSEAVTFADVERSFRNAMEFGNELALHFQRKAIQEYEAGAVMCDELAAQLSSDRGKPQNTKLQMYVKQKGTNMRARSKGSKPKIAGIKAKSCQKCLPAFYVQDLAKSYTAVNAPTPSLMAQGACSDTGQESIARAWDLRTKLQGYRTRVMICITMYNEDETELNETMLKVARNIEYHCYMDSSKNEAERYGEKPMVATDFVVCIISDGRVKANEGTLRALQHMHLYNPDAVNVALLGDAEITMHLFETDVHLVYSPTNDDDDDGQRARESEQMDGWGMFHKEPEWEAVEDAQGLYYYNSTTGETTWDRPAAFEGTGADNHSSCSNTGGWEAVEDAQGLYYYNSTTGETSWDRPAALDDDALNRNDGIMGRHHRMPCMFALKEHNAGKLNSHLWGFEGFAEMLESEFIVLVDVGTKPTPSAISRLLCAMNRNRQIGGCCGEIAVDHPFRYLAQPVVASQHFEYKVSNLMDKALESVFGFISVLPGAFSAYRFYAIRGRPLDMYFASIKADPEKDFGAFKGNMYLAEDRILVFELLTKKDCSWTMHYVKNAVARTDVPVSLVDLVKQRRRWLNGSFFALFYTLINFSRFYTDSSHSLLRKAWVSIEFVYMWTQIFLTWMLPSILYLTIHYTFVEFIPDTQDKIIPRDWFYVNRYIDHFVSSLGWIYVSFIMLNVVMGLGNKPTELGWVYMASSMYFAFLIVTMSVLVSVILCQLQLQMSRGTRSQQAPGAISPPPSPPSLASLIKHDDFGAHNNVPENASTRTPVLRWENSFFDAVGSMSEVLVYMLGTIFAPFIGALFHGELGHLILTFPQYVMMIPTSVNIMTIYAFCNLHDLSWGTKGAEEVVSHHGSAGKTGSFNNIVEQKALEQEAKKKAAARQSHIDIKYRKFRTYILFAWLFCNFSFIQFVVAFDPTGVHFLKALVMFGVIVNGMKVFGSLAYMAIRSVRHGAHSFCPDFIQYMHSKSVGDHALEQRRLAERKQLHTHRPVRAPRTSKPPLGMDPSEYHLEGLEKNTSKSLDLEPDKKLSLGMGMQKHGSNFYASNPMSQHGNLQAAPPPPPGPPPAHILAALAPTHGTHTAMAGAL